MFYEGKEVITDKAEVVKGEYLFSERISEVIGDGGA